LNTEETLVSQITATALLGTGRAGHVTFNADGSLGAALAKIQEQQDPARRLLDSAAIVFLSSRVGATSHHAEIQHQTPASEERFKSCSPAANILIEQTVSGSYSRLLPEVLMLLAISKLRLPYSFLPDILDIGCVQKSLRPSIVSTIGERGIWLAAQNPAWAYVDTILSTHGQPDFPGTVDWETATVDTRVSIIRFTRKQDPGRAIERMSLNWRKETSSTKLQLLKELDTGLSIADETFLESALDDKSVEVRQAAALLLARIPDSSFADQALQKTNMFLSIHKRPFDGLDIIVSLPSAYLPEWSRYGIGEKSEIKDIGDRAWWFIQWAGFISPEYWSKRLGMSPDEMLLAVEKSEWASLLRLAWSRSARGSSDIFWKYAVARYWATQRDGRTSVGSMFPKINDLGEKAENLLLYLLKDETTPLSDTHPASNLLAQYESAWSETLARQVIGSIKRRIAAPSVGNNQLYLTIGLLENSAYKIPSHLADELGSDWPTTATEWKFWEQASKAFTDVLHFRCQIHKEIQS
jgi:hypothetical protein